MALQCLGYRSQTSLHIIKVSQNLFSVHFPPSWLVPSLHHPKKLPFICQDVAQILSLLQEDFPDPWDGKKKNLGKEENEIRYFCFWHLPYRVIPAVTSRCPSEHLSKWSSPDNSSLTGSYSQYPPLLFWTRVGNSPATASLGFLHSPWESPTSCRTPAHEGPIGR